MISFPRETHSNIAADTGPSANDKTNWFHY
jgi:hypothetical protein